MAAEGTTEAEDTADAKDGAASKALQPTYFASNAMLFCIERHTSATDATSLTLKRQ